MRLSALLKLTFAANIIASAFIALPSANAGTFDEKEIAQDQMIAIAAPYRHGYNLVVIEQVPGKEKCWAEQGITPVAVKPLLMNFDFSGHCRRATDSNGYSVRMGGEEKGSDYLLKIVEKDNELVLIGTQRDPNQAPIVLGRTHGKSEGVTKIFLNPGWRFTKRSYQGQELSHFYFSDGVASTTAKASQVTIQEAVNSIPEAPQVVVPQETKSNTQASNVVTEEVSTLQETDQLF